ncbi:MAG: hypothetical protein A2Y92_01810 [Chloroflexi bacterium RBG_13_57_8]|nr:MAG: hypothetical protein A2Y92_01810 [Chloroflexi bacterium RBG_13_57_8]
MPQMLVYFSKVTHKPQRTLFQRSFDIDVQEAISPDKSISRYGRPWRFSKPKIHHGYLVGKLGFVSPGTETRADYDEQIKDFIEQTVDSKQSMFVFWAIDLSEQVLAFEAKPPDIMYQSFKGAFEGFLAERPDIGLTVEDFVQTSKFVAWVKNVERVISFKANLRAPNPNFSKHPKIIQEILGDTNADRARLELVKLKDSTDGLNTETTIKDVVKYGEDGYSSIVARGEKGERLKIFDSRKRVPLERVDIPKGIADDAKWNLIIDAVRKFINETFK